MQAMAASGTAGESDSDMVMTTAAPTTRRPTRFAAAVLVGLVLAVTTLVAHFVASPRGTAIASPKPQSDVVGLQEWPQSAGGQVLPSGISVPPPMAPMLDAYFTQMMGIPSSAVAGATSEECRSNEEVFQGLCYMKCALLTNGTFSLRTSAWTCCRAHSVEECFVSNQGLDFGLCSGYDVAGDGQSCPHFPGKCMDNEELFLGECYAKCSILTDGQKPYRTSAISCCESRLGLSCFMPGKVVVSDQMNTGGGRDDGDASTPAKPYSPYAQAGTPVAAGGAPIAD
mmetsp:Transcript_52684/g.151855  ORF Transcript_52684/g.151855 Transcript_52684/m.151855 type:complete len:284 (+) Transcript_52684:73-924(+)